MIPRKMECSLINVWTAVQENEIGDNERNLKDYDTSRCNIPFLPVTPV
ncbi:hypothetical protein QUF75_18355 [Desulfococcaceae bacterium HSG7]|nr:hypothetical protein [Desulfococcaceae bacterium HSG7]